MHLAARRFALAFRTRLRRIRLRLRARPAQALLAAILALPASAQTLYWDSDGATPGTTNIRNTWWPVGDSRLWWSTSAAGDTATQGWVSGATAVFSAGTNATGYTLVDIGQGVNVSAIYVEEGSIELWGAYFSGFFYDLSTFDVAAGADAILDATMRESGGAVNFTKTGAGTLTVNAPNQMTGAFTVLGGTVNITSQGNLSSGDLTVNNGATLANTGILELNNRTVNVSGAGSTLSSTNYIEFADIGDVTVNLTAGGTISSQSSVAFGVNVGATGTASVSGDGSTLSSGSQIHVGYYGVGELTVASGGRVAPGTILDLATYAGSTGTFNLNSGGTLAVGGTNGIVKGAGTANLNLGGGTLEVTGSNLIVSVPANLVSGTTSTINTNGLNALFNGGFSGAGGLAKSGDGTLNLPTANTYSGGTTVNAGTLQLGNLSSLGSTSANLTLNGGILDLGSWTPTVGTVIFNGGTFTNGTLNNAAAYEVRTGSLSAPLGGSAGLTKTGSGSFTLSGANTYAGGTVVNDGTLSVAQAGSLGTGDITITGGTLAGSTNLSLDRTVGVAGAGANLTTVGYLEIGSIGTGTLTVSAGGQVASGTSTGFGITDTANGTGTITGADSRLDVGGTLYLGYHGAGSLTVANGGAVAADSLQLGIGEGTGAFHLNTGGTLEVGGTNAIQTGTGTLNLAGGTLLVTEADLTTASAATLSNTSILHTNGRNATFSGVLSGSGALNKAGAGTLTLTANNTYTGGTVIDAGIVANGIDQALASGHSVVVNASGTYDLAGHDQNLAGVSGAGVITLGSGNLQIGATGASSTFTGSISGTGDLTKTGAGTFTLSGNNPYSGTTTVSGGTLSAGGATSLGTGAINVSGGTLAGSANLSLDRTVTVDGSASTLSTAGYLEIGSAGSGSLTIGNGGQVASGTSTAFGVLGSSVGTGSITGAGSRLDVTGALYLGYLGEGTLTVAGGGALAAGSINFGGGGGSGILNLDTGGVLEIGGTDAITVAGGSAAFNLGGGTLKVTGDALTTSVPITFVSGTASAINTNGLDTVLGGTLSGTGTFQKTGAGNLLLTSANPFGGLTEIQAGTLTLGHGQALQNSTVSPGSTLGFGSLTEATLGGLTGSGGITLTNTGSGAVALGVGNNNADTTYSGPLSGAGSLHKIGSGTLTLSGASSHTGGTTVGAGTLALGHATDTLPDTGAVTVSGGTLSLGANSDTIGALTLSSGSVTGSGTLSAASIDARSGTISAKLGGDGGLAKTTGGTVTLSGTNTYTGGTTINAGTLVASSDANLGATSGNVTINAGGILSANANLITDRAITVTGSGAILSNFGEVIIGNSATSSLSVANSGAATAYNLGVGYNSGGDGTVTVNSGGSVSVSNETTLGRFADATGDLSVSGSGSSFTTVNTLFIGDFGTGATTLADGGTLTAGALRIANQNGSSGTLNLDDGGILRVGGTDGISFGTGTAAFNAKGGTLQVNGSHLTTSAAIALGDTTTSTVNTNGLNATLSGVLSGSGALAKTGTGTLTLSGTNTYSGGTTLSGGTVAVTSDAHLGATSGSVLIQSGAQLSTGGYFFTDRNITASGPGSSLINNGELIVAHNASAALGLDSSAGASAYNLGIGYNPGVTGTVSLASGATFGVSNETLLGRFGGAVGNLHLTGSGTTFTGGNTFYLGYLGAGTTTVADGATFRVPTLSIATLGGSSGTLNLDSGGTLQIGGADGITAGAGTAAFNANGGTLQVVTADLTTSVPVTLGANSTSQVNTNGFNATLSGALSGSGNLDKTGAGNLTLATANPFTGNTSISAGTLTLGSGDALGASTLTSANGLRFGSLTTATLGGLSGSENLSLLNGSSQAVALTVGANSADTTYSGVLSGAGASLIKTGSGNLTLTGNNTYTGTTTVGGGTLTIDGADRLGTGSVLVDGGTLAGSAHLSFDQAVTVDGGGSTLSTVDFVEFGSSGTGSLTVTDGGQVSSGSSTGFGILATTQGSGLVTGSGSRLDAGGTLYLGYLGEGILTLANGGSVVTDSANFATGSGSSGTLNLNSGGTLQIGGTNAITRGTGSALFNLGGGTLQVIDENLTTSVPATLVAGTTSTIDTNSHDASLSGTISGSGNLVKTGAGDLLLADGNTYSGTTTVSGGTLSLNNVSALGTGGVGVTSGTLTGLGNLSFDRAVTVGGANAGLSSVGYLEFGSAGTGSLTVSNGAQVGSGSSTAFGVLATADGTGLVTGADSRLDVTGTLFLGYLGDGTLTIADGGTVSAGAINFSAAGGTGILNLNTGGTLEVGGNNPVAAGSGPAQFNFGGGTLKVTGSSLVSSFPFTLLDGTTSAVNTNGFDATLSGLISGSGGFAKSGAGTLTLSGANTYTGTTFVNAGTLQIVSLDNIGASGSVSIGDGALLDAGNLSFTLNRLVGGGELAIGSGTLTLGGAGSYGFSGKISGDGGSLIKTGASTVTLLGNHSYSGTTTVNQGTLSYIGVQSFEHAATVDGADSVLTTSSTLHVGNTGTGSLTIINGGTVTSALNAAIATSAGSTGTVTVSGAGSNFSSNSEFYVGLAGDGTLNIENGASFYSNQLLLGVSAGSSGALTVDDATLNLGPGGLTTPAAGTNDIHFNDATIRYAQTNAAPFVGAATLTGANTFDIQSGGLVQYGVLSGTGSLIKTGDSNLALVAQNTYTGGTTINAGKITLATNDALKTDSALTLGGSGTFDVATFTQALPSIQGTGVIALGTGTLSLGGADTSSTLNATLTGDGTLEKTGTGTLTLDATSTFNGTALISGGTLANARANTLSGSATVNVGSSGTYHLSNYDQSIGSLTGTGTVMLGAGTLTVGADNSSSTFSGTIEDGGRLIKTGTGTFTLAGTLNHTGGTTVNGGALAIASDSVLGPTSPALSVVTLDGGALATTASFTLDADRIIYVGTSGGTIDTASATTLIFGGQIIGSGSFTKTGDGTLLLTGPSSSPTEAVVEAGTLALGHATNTFGDNTRLTLNGSTLDLGSNSDKVYSLSLNGGVITGSGSLDTDSIEAISGTIGSDVSAFNIFAKTGSGTLNLNADATTSSFRLEQGSITGTGTITAGNFEIQSGTIGVDLVGDGRLVKITGGDATLSGTNTFGGGLELLTGTLFVASDSALGATPDTFDAGNLYFQGGTLATTASFSLGSNRGITLGSGSVTIDTAAGTTLTQGGAISGGGSLIKTGDGTLALTGTNTHSGTTTIRGGTLSIDSAAALGAASSQLIIDGSTLATTSSFTLDGSVRYLSVSGSGGTIDTAGGTTLTIDGALGGSGALTKTGEGSLLLSSGLYQIETHVGAGSLLLGNGDAFSYGTNQLTNNGVVVLNHSNDITLSGSLSGTGAFTKSGGGTLTLSGTNTQSGTFTVEGGTVSIDSANRLGTGAVVINHGSLSSTNSLIFNQAVTVTGADSSLSTAGYLELGNGGDASLHLADGASATSASSTALGLTPGATATVTATGTDSIFTTTTALSVGLNGTGVLTIEDGAEVHASSVNVATNTGSSGTVHLNPGGTLGFGGSGLNAGSGTAQINFAGGTARATGSGSVFVIDGYSMFGPYGHYEPGPGTSSAPITFVEGTTSTIDTGDYGAVFAGVLSGAGSLTKIGASTLTLSGNNTHSGTTTISEGTLAVANGVNLGAGTIDVNGGTLLGTHNLALDNTIHVSGADSTFGIAGYLELGTSGSGSLTLDAGGRANITSTANLGSTAAGEGNATITGADSTLSVASTFYVGYAGAGTLTVSDGGTVSASGLRLAEVGGSNATVHLNPGGTLELGAGGISAGSGTAALTFADATLRITADTQTFIQTGGGIFGPPTGYYVTTPSAISTDITLADAAQSTFDTNTFAANISGIISGSGSLLKTGAGTLTLTGANTYSGGTTVTGGTLDVSDFSRLGTGDLLVSGGAFTTAGVGILDREVTVSGAGSTFGFASYLEVGPSGVGSLTIDGGATVTSPATIAIGNHETGVGTIHVSGTGSNLVSTNALFVGISGQADLTIENGAQVNAPDVQTALHAGSVANIHINSGAGLVISGTGNLTAGAGSASINLAGGIIYFTELASIYVIDYYFFSTPFGHFEATPAAILAFDTTLAPDTVSTFGSAGRPVSVNGTLTGGGAFAVGGPGVVTLNAANTHTGGNTVNEGTLKLGHADALGSTTADLTLNGGILDLSGYSPTVGTAIFNGGTFYSGSLDNASAFEVRTGTMSNPLGGSAPLTKTGAGTFTLSGANTYAGGTTIEDGTLVLAHATALGATGGDLTLNGGTLDLGTHQPMVGTVRFNGGTFTNGTLDNATAFEVGTGSLDVALGGSAALTKTGAGTFTLSGANTYAGGTIVSDGSLRLANSSGSAAGSGPVTVRSGASLIGVGSFTGALIVEAGGTLAPGNSPGLMTIGDGSVFAGTLNMELGGLARGIDYDAINVTGSVTFGGTLTVTLINNFTPMLGDSFQLFSFTSFGGSFSQVSLPAIAPGLAWNTSRLLDEGTLEVSAIPEPSAFAALAGLATLALAATRRRRR